MGIINNLPVILAASTAFLAGLYGYMNHMPNAQIYGNMCLFLIVFYIIGLFLRRTIRNIREEIESGNERQSVADTQIQTTVEADTAGQDREGAADTAGDAAEAPGDEYAEEADYYGADYYDAGEPADGDEAVIPGYYDADAAPDEDQHAT